MTVLIFFLVLFVLILVHEYGHFSVAKWFGIRVDEFGIGFPPKLFGLKKGETEYTFNLLPIGGFVRIFGEDPDDASTNGPDRARSFVHQPKLVQAAVLVAGVTFNVLFAWLLISIAFMVGVPSGVLEEDVEDLSKTSLVVTQVTEGSPAWHAGLMARDEITQLRFGDDVINAPLTPSMVSDFIAAHARESIVLTYIRSDVEETVQVVPEIGVIEDDPDRPVVGIVMALTELERLAPHVAIYEGGKTTIEILIAVTIGLGTLLVQTVSFQADLSQVAGPIGIVGLVGDASALGFVYLMTFTAFISLNLAVINLLPFPALDGGRLLFVIIETIKGSRIRPQVVNALNTIGFILLIVLMVAVTYNDIIRVF